MCLQLCILILFCLHYFLNLLWIWDIFWQEWKLSKICNTKNALILWIKDFKMSLNLWEILSLAIKNPSFKNIVPKFEKTHKRILIFDHLPFKFPYEFNNPNCTFSLLICTWFSSFSCLKYWVWNFKNIIYFKLEFLRPSI